jgi:alpha-L-fucosidase 2
MFDENLNSRMPHYGHVSRLWYARPARTWTEALPIGNGLQGAMIFGDPLDDRIQINEGTAWSGSHLSEAMEPVVMGKETIARARTAIAAGDYGAADAAMRRLQHRHSQAFMPFADLRVRLTAGEDISDYERRLDLETATYESRFRVGGSLVRRTAFASYPDRVLVYRLDTELPFTLELTSPLRVIGDDGPLTLLLRLPSDVAPTHDDMDEPVVWEDASLRGAVVVGVRGADLIIGTATNFDGIARPPRGDEHTALERAREAVEHAMRLGADQVYERHLADYRSLFARVRWEPTAAATDAGTPATADADAPTDRRLAAANEHPDGALAADPALAPLLFDYGRYLLISSSRAGGVPANLQGIWNDDPRPPWSSNYTTNINLEMNYWPADVTNLPECLPPLVDLVEGLSRTGAETARRLYDAPGWVAHHNADIWGYSQPVGHGHHAPKWAFWPFGGVWLATALCDHLSFGARASARDEVWPLIRSAAEFLLAWLVPFDDGSLGTSPSTSPENEFFTGDGVAGVSRSSTMDLVLAAELLRGVIAFGPADDPVVDRARRALPLLPGPALGTGGMIREWWHDPVATEPDHRHQSHLWFVYPGTGPEAQAEAEAASRSLNARGDDSTGWSLAWRLALRARLGQPEAVSRLLRLFFQPRRLYPNLFSAHPPFQIDGNFGYVAAVAEMFVQSHAGEIVLLPSVPAEFGAGSISGLVARPGVSVDLRWDTDLIDARLRPLTAGARRRHRVRYRDRVAIVDLSGGDAYMTAENDLVVSPLPPRQISKPASMLSRYQSGLIQWLRSATRKNGASSRCRTCQVGSTLRKEM